MPRCCASVQPWRGGTLLLLARQAKALMWLCSPPWRCWGAGGSACTCCAPRTLGCSRTCSCSLPPPQPQPRRPPCLPMQWGPMWQSSGRRWSAWAAQSAPCTRLAAPTPWQQQQQRTAQWQQQWARGCAAAQRARGRGRAQRSPVQPGGGPGGPGARVPGSRHGREQRCAPGGAAHCAAQPAAPEPGHGCGSGHCAQRSERADAAQA